MLGTIANAVAIFIGSIFGVFLKNHVNEKINETVLQALGLAVFIIGVSGALGFKNLLLVIFSLVIGAALGEWLDIEGALDRFGKAVQDRFKTADGNLSKAFVSATLLFCVGSMAVVGALTSGLTGDNSILYAKASLDGVIAFVFASTMGIGVLLSGISVLLYQGTIVLLAGFIKPIFDYPNALEDLTAVGSILIIGIGINILEIKRIRVGNMLPAILVPIVYYAILMI